MWRKHHKDAARARGGQEAGGGLRRLAAWLLPLVMMAAVAPAQAQAQSKLRLAKGLYAQSQGPASPPVGFLEFCDRYPEECRPLGQPATWRIHLDATRWNLIRQVNTYVNRRVRPMTDQEIYNRPEVWEYPVNGKGDCEDYVLLKKRYLEALGLPSEALMIAVVLDEKGGGHAVLLVRTDRGDFALDNRRNAILPWNRTGYKFLLRQSQRHPARWVALTKDPYSGPRAFGNNQ